MVGLASYNYYNTNTKLHNDNVVMWISNWLK